MRSWKRLNFQNKGRIVLKVQNALNEEYKLLINLLAEERRKTKITQRSLSSLLSKSYTFIQKVESFERQINPKELMDVLDALRVPFIPFMESYRNKVLELRKAAETQKLD
jgi:transcriptional regulator with XRE-family HTH domain